MRAAAAWPAERGARRDGPEGALRAGPAGQCRGGLRPPRRWQTGGTRPAPTWSRPSTPRRPPSSSPSPPAPRGAGRTSTGRPRNTIAAGLCAQNMALKGHALGLGFVFLNHLSHEQAKALLGTPYELDLVGVMAFGRPAETARSERMDRARVVYDGGFENRKGFTAVGVRHSGMREAVAEYDVRRKRQGGEGARARVQLSGKGGPWGRRRTTGSFRPFARESAIRSVTRYDLSSKKRPTRNHALPSAKKTSGSPSSISCVRNSMRPCRAFTPGRSGRRGGADLCGKPPATSRPSNGLRKVAPAQAAQKGPGARRRAMRGARRTRSVRRSAARARQRPTRCRRDSGESCRAFFSSLLGGELGLELPGPLDGGDHLIGGGGHTLQRDPRLVLRPIDGLNFHSGKPLQGLFHFLLAPPSGHPRHGKSHFSGLAHGTLLQFKAALTP